MKFDQDKMMADYARALAGEGGYTVEQYLKEYGEQMKIVPDTDFHKLKINFINKSDNANPEYAKEGDSGFDLRADLSSIQDDLFDGKLMLGSLDRKLIPTGLFFEIPIGFELQVRPRSGLAAKQGLTVLNTPGTVDSGYRGEIKVILINLSKEVQVIQHGDRIAQGVITPVMTTTTIKLNQTDQLSDSERGTGGFGSTGKK